MIKHSRKVRYYIRVDGGEGWDMEGADLFLPETDEEIKRGMVSIKTDLIEVLLFNPAAVILGPKTNVQDNVPEEMEIPEKDR